MKQNAEDLKQQLKDGAWPGIVVDTNDPYKRGKIKVRVFRVYDTISVEDIPWASPRNSVDGKSFNIPSKGKIVNVIFPDGDWYTPEYDYAEHFNINLQKKLEDLNESAYQQFGAIQYDHDWQIYSEPTKEGFILDYYKSNINMRTNGDIRINLRDNKSKLFLGTEDADEPAMLGNHWMKWFDEFVKNMMGAYGGPFIGNNMAPVIPHPKFLQNCNEFFAKRATFLSNHVLIVDNKSVKAQKRKFDQKPDQDSYKEEKKEGTFENNPPITSGYEPQDRPDTGKPVTKPLPESNKTSSTAVGNKVSNQDLSKNLNTGVKGANPNINTVSEPSVGSDALDKSKSRNGDVVHKGDKNKLATAAIIAGAIGVATIAALSESPSPSVAKNTAYEVPKNSTQPPIESGFSNGKLPVNRLTMSRYLALYFDETEDTPFLIDEASKDLDLWMERYEKEKLPEWPNIIFTEGYRNYARQEALKRYTSDAPTPGTSDHGWATAVDMHFGFDASLKRDISTRTQIYKTDIWKWLTFIGQQYGWQATNKIDSSTNDVEWWHWSYDNAIKIIK